VVCLADGLAGLGQAAIGAVPASNISAGVVMTWAVMVMGICLADGRDRFRQYTPLALPGAERLLLTPDRASVYRALVESVRPASDAFLVTTGFNSLYGWTGVPPPSRVIIGNEIRVFTEDEQVDMVRSLLTHRRPMIVANRERAPAATTPFMRETARAFHPWRRIGPFTLFVPNDRPDPNDP